MWRGPCPTKAPPLPPPRERHFSLYSIAVPTEGFRPTAFIRFTRYQSHTKERLGQFADWIARLGKVCLGRMKEARGRSAAIAERPPTLTSCEVKTMYSPFS